MGVNSSLRQDLVEVSFAKNSVDDSKRDTDHQSYNPVDNAATPVVATEREVLKF